MRVTIPMEDTATVATVCALVDSILDYEESDDEDLWSRRVDDEDLEVGAALREGRLVQRRLRVCITGYVETVVSKLFHVIYSLCTCLGAR